MSTVDEVLAWLVALEREDTGAMARSAADEPMSEQDQPIPEDEKIRAAFPTRSGDHETYAEAMRMVGAKHSKQALIELVNWLLMRAKVAEDRNAELVKLVEEILEKDSVCCEFVARACCDVYPESKKWWCWTCRAEALLEMNDDQH